MLQKCSKDVPAMLQTHPTGTSCRFANATELPRFYRVLLGFTGYYLVLPSFTGIYLVLLGIIGLYLVLLFFLDFT